MTGSGVNSSNTVPYLMHVCNAIVTLVVVVALDTSTFPHQLKRFVLRRKLMAKNLMAVLFVWICNLLVALRSVSNLVPNILRMS